MGKFEYANGGTLFLDEVGDMPLATQIKLLRVLESGEIIRVGTNEPIKVNVRLISATNRDLDDAIAAGTFRSDLYHRLKVVSVKLPPLRERREDIPLLIEHFLKEFTAGTASTISGDHTGRAQGPDGVLAGRATSGSCKNAIESMVVIDVDGVLDVDDLTEDLQAARSPAAGDGPGGRRFAGRQVARGNREALHRRDPEAHQRQPRGSRQDAGHRRADALSQDQGIRAWLKASDRSTDRARRPHAAIDSTRQEPQSDLSERKITLYTGRVDGMGDIAMGIIRQLPQAVINQIAAGEVVERPASVVKELLENAIDAGATRVDLTVERGGKDLVRVADNGAGMAPDDLLLAFQPHATSKLAEADDLYRIAHAGLPRRGAGGDRRGLQGPLPDAAGRGRRGLGDRDRGGDVGPVKRLRLPGRHGDRGPQPVLQHAGAAHVPEVGHRPRPGHVVEMFSRIALANPTVHLTYRSGGKIVHDLPPVAGHRASGSRSSSAASWPSRCSGSRAGWTRCTSGATSRIRRRAGRRAKGQFLFLGGRYVRDRSLSHALNEAYRGLLMVGRMPVAFLHLDIPPEEVDVNVHPTKVEVRFRDSNRIYSHLLATLRQTFLKSDLHARLQAAQEPAAAESATPATARHAAADPGPAIGAGAGAAAWDDSTWRAVRPTGRRSPRGSSRAGPVRMPGLAPAARAAGLGAIAADGVRRRAGRTFDEFSAPAHGRIGGLADSSAGVAPDPPTGAATAPAPTAEAAGRPTTVGADERPRGRQQLRPTAIAAAEAPGPRSRRSRSTTAT